MCKSFAGVFHASSARWFTAACFVVALPLPLAVAADPLTVTVTDNRRPGDMLYLAVYAGDGEEGWRAPPVMRAKQSMPNDEQFQFELSLPAGSYAVRAFVDTNANGELDEGRFNRPREPFAISLGPGRSEPSIRFEHAVFSIGGNSDLHLQLHYPRDDTDS